MRLGRLDEETTANVGVIRGGVAANVVPESCTIEAEVRSLDDGKASEAVQRDGRHDHLGRERDRDRCRHHDRGALPRLPHSRVGPDRGDRVGGHAATAGWSRCRTSTGGGSDASAFDAKGLRCLNLAIGVELNHTPHERVSAAALEKMLDITLRLAERAPQVRASC